MLSRQSPFILSPRPCSHPLQLPCHGSPSRIGPYASFPHEHIHLRDFCRMHVSLSRTLSFLTARSSNAFLNQHLAMADLAASRSIEPFHSGKPTSQAPTRLLKASLSTREPAANPRLALLPAAGRACDPRARRCQSLSPLSSATPVLASQPSMVTMSNDSFRSPSALDEIPPSLLRRYPRFSTATTSIDTGRPNFSADELTSTELSDDEDAILNDELKRGSSGTRSLMRHKIARDVRAMWSSNASRLRYARQRIKNIPRGSTRLSHVQQHPDPRPNSSHGEATESEVCTQAGRERGLMEANGRGQTAEVCVPHLWGPPPENVDTDVASLLG
jgi:hypothetical protein